MVDYLGTCAQCIIMGELNEEIKLEVIGDDDPLDYSGDKCKEVNEEQEFYSEAVQAYTDKMCSNCPRTWSVWPFSVWLDFFEKLSVEQLRPASVLFSLKISCKKMDISELLDICFSTNWNVR